MEITVNAIIVGILADRIINGGMNPLKKRPMKLDDVKHVEYRKAVEDCMITQSRVVDETPDAQAATEDAKNQEINIPSAQSNAREEKTENNK